MRAPGDVAPFRVAVARDTEAVRTVLVVDDRALPRIAMRAILDDVPNMRQVGEAASGAEAVELTRRLHPDIILLDVEMPNMSGVDTAKAIFDLGPPVPMVIAWTVSDAGDDLLRMMRAGCSGYILKDVGPQELSRAVKAATDGGTPIPRRLIPDLLARAVLPVPDGSRDPVSLTPREIVVLKQLAIGSSSKEIASRLRISPRSVETHLENLYRKLSVGSRGQAVRVALKRGLLTAADF